MAKETIAVIGLGTMGSQIGIVFARAGFTTFVFDQDHDRLEQGRKKVRDFLEQQVSKGKMAAELRDQTLANLQAVFELEAAVGEADLVVEAVFEDIGVKRELFAQMDRLARPETILASNTSTLSITEIAGATQSPERCIGAHFLIPAGLTPLVEVTRGLLTSDAAHDRLVELLKAAGKDTVTVNDAPGFVINRLYIPLLNEAFFALEEGVASAEDIDKACAKGLGFPLGPLAASDASGLDVVLACVESLHRQLGDKHRPAPLLVKLVRAGRLGRKTGRGVYEYKR